MNTACRLAQRRSSPYMSSIERSPRFSGVRWPLAYTARPHRYFVNGIRLTLARCCHIMLRRPGDNETQQGADVIYNEPTFPALLSTLSDRRLCSENTLVYLATMLVRSGGRVWYGVCVGKGGVVRPPCLEAPNGVPLYITRA